MEDGKTRYRRMVRNDPCTKIWPLSAETTKELKQLHEGCWVWKYLSKSERGQTCTRLPGSMTPPHLFQLTQFWIEQQGKKQEREMEYLFLQSSKVGFFLPYSAPMIPENLLLSQENFLCGWSWYNVRRFRGSCFWNSFQRELDNNLADGSFYEDVSFIVVFASVPLTTI